MTLVREFPSGLELGAKGKPDTRGKMYLDDQGGLWVLLENKVARISQQDGTLLKEITFPENTNVMGFCIDVKNSRLLAANRGKDSNILIYSDIYGSNPQFSETFGETRRSLFKDGDSCARRNRSIAVYRSCGRGS
ncbi:hypothetical protein NXV73_18465 [Bacteroides salyersiae]|nr:hypothetical protein [Bacteroides salyersiae]